MKYSLLLWLLAGWGLSATAQRTSIQNQLTAMRKIAADGSRDSATASKAAIKLLPQLDPDNPLLARQGNDSIINSYLDGFFEMRHLAGTATNFDNSSDMRLKYVLYNVQSDRVRWAYYQRVAAERTALNDDYSILKEVKADLALVVPARQRMKYDSLFSIWYNVRQGEPAPAFTLYNSQGGRLLTNAPGEKMWVIQTYAPSDTASMRTYRSFCALAQRFAKDTNFIFIGVNLQHGAAPSTMLPQYHLSPGDIPAFRRLYAIHGNSRGMIIRNGYFQMATIPDAPEDMLALLLQYNTNMHYPDTEHGETSINVE
ncbi:hypothetical protein HGH93_23705 [Chitinophaga polysaccharea]|uniref:hypothetical protein n=1 Tax=Chitinophaga TaxID=79328 RepID=UPI0014553E5B|nr:MULTISPECIES: hypothetical protein [Chitinophaga]NLR61127.1 hypothetical protein [Chitinophaga polysaccharea]NLU94965.1 hypothetical protein [Chitinophaga sp. Ak27]